MTTINLAGRLVGEGQPCYLVAEIGSNFDGDLERAKRLAKLAKECGADAAKFQSFLPHKIIRPEGFAEAEGFQARWSRPVLDVYRDAALPRPWHLELRDYCREIGIQFFSSPYDAQALELLEELDVPVCKIGSGEIDNLAFLEQVAAIGRPVVLGTGASTFAEVARAVEVLRLAGCHELILLQCVTNYPSRIESAAIRAMARMATAFDVPVGYSDHSPGHLVAVGAVALGACVIEKHFTDDRNRAGPDHPFAMDAEAFSTMVEQIRLLELAMGDGEKRVMPEEERTRVIQRRGLWVVRDCAQGQVLTSDDLAVLRPAHGLAPGALNAMLGLRLTIDVPAGTALQESMVRGV